MATERLSQQMKDLTNLNSAQDSTKCQNIVETFLTLLREGKLEKGKHAALVKEFVVWVQPKPFWELALPMAPEFREGCVQDSYMVKYPNVNNEHLFHPHDILAMLHERIHRPKTDEELREDAEWAAQVKKAGLTIVGTPEWYDKMREEMGQQHVDEIKEFIKKPAEEQFRELGPFAIQFGKPISMGELVR